MRHTVEPSRNQLSVVLFPTLLLLVFGITSPLSAQFGGDLGGGGFGGGELGGGGLGGGEVKSGKRSGARSPGAAGRFEPLVRVITTTIEPDCWSRVGGAGEIEAVDAWGLVVISQTDEVHQQIESLIAVLRQARREQGAGSSTSSADDDKHRKPASLLAGSRADTAAQKRIEAALASETSLEFIETPLADVVEAIRRKHGIPVQLDRRSLDGVGIGSDTPITRTLQGISLRSALRLILGDLDLTYMIHDEVLLISTPEEAETHLVTRVYKVQDLALPASETPVQKPKDE